MWAHLGMHHAYDVNIMSPLSKWKEHTDQRGVINSRVRKRNESTLVTQLIFMFGVSFLG